MPVDGQMELRPDRPGWGLEIDEKALQTDDYIHWERKVTPQTRWRNCLTRNNNQMLTLHVGIFLGLC